MKRIVVVMIALVLIACKNDSKESVESKSQNKKSENTTTKFPFELTPIQHATFVMQWEDEVVYVDPVGNKESFTELPEPSLVFITDIHGDHFNVETLENLSQTFDVVAPKAVYEKMPENLQSRTKIINNGESFNFHGFDIKAIPMYNITEERIKFHEKGRGNGYVIGKDDYRVYISGDTEDIPEMRKLENIDLAFLCMNLPYTMTPKAAAVATLEFQPKKVIPYHYRGAKDGETFYYDVDEFKKIVTTRNEEIEVELLDWYPNK